MTETLFIVVTALAAILFTDPVQGGALTKSAAAKMLVFVLVWAATGLHLIGRAMYAPARLAEAVRALLVAWWPLLLLAAWITAGSLFARLGLGIRETFLNFGLGIFYVAAVALVVETSERLEYFLKGLLAVYALMLGFMLFVLVLDKHVLHEEIFVATAGALFFFGAQTKRFLSAVAGLIALALCLLSFKNTTFLLILAMLSLAIWLGFLRVLQNKNSLRASLVIYVSVIALIGSALGVYFAWLELRSSLPGGSTQFRTYTYGVAWQRFLNSPLFGTGFTDKSTVYFPLYEVAVGTQNLPTHSDVLDLLAHGGVVAFALWVLAFRPLLCVARETYTKLSSPEVDSQEILWRWILVLLGVQVGAVITYSFNPPLFSNLHGFFIWGSLGLLWGLWRRTVQLDILSRRRF